MESTVKRVLTTAKIIFSNGQEYTIPMVNPNNPRTPDLQNYGTKCTLKQSLYKGTSTDVIGNICCSSLYIEGRSYDKLLITSSAISPYHGLMNNTAKVEIRCTGDDNVETFMGTYYVDTWECGTSSSDYDSFYITCVDLLSKIKNISLKKVRLKQRMKFSEYLKTVIDKINLNLSQDLRVNYTLSTLEKMDNLYNANWQMYYNNIDMENIETIFNTLAQNTLSYVWIDRNNYLQVDSLIDDNQSETVCTLSGLDNLFSYDIQQGDIGNYSGLSVEYISAISYKDEQLLQLQDFELYVGKNNITAQLNTDKALRINLIDINCEDGTRAVCTGFFNYKNEIDMTIKSLTNTKATITIYGQVIDETYNTKTVYKNNSIRGNVLEVKNHLLRAEDIDTYVDNFLRLISMENSSMSAEGYLNPQLKLSDMVAVVGTRLSISNYYKVVDLEFSLGTSYRCKASLMKTIESQVSIEAILGNDNEFVLGMMGGDTVDTTYEFLSPTPSQETQIQNYIGTQLTELQSFL
jgi:hypothetical protein